MSHDRFLISSSLSPALNRFCSIILSLNLANPKFGLPFYQISVLRVSSLTSRSSESNPDVTVSVSVRIYRTYILHLLPSAYTITRRKYVHCGVPSYLDLARFSKFSVNIVLGRVPVHNPQSERLFRGNLMLYCG